MAEVKAGSRLDRHLPFWRRLTYGVGHVFNDLCAAVWFSYLLVFFEDVMLMSKAMAGNIMFVGQVVDAICTPLIGIESDQTRGLFNYGKRKSWHLLGMYIL